MEVAALPGFALTGLGAGLAGATFFTAFAGLAATFFSGLGADRVAGTGASADRCTIVKRI